jgi:RNA polymerase primary sigma factor
MKNHKIQVIKRNRIKQLNFLFERYKLVRKGRLNQYYKEIRQYPILNKETEFELARRIREDNDVNALEQFIGSNLRIVISIAKRFQGDRLSMFDLISAGNEGLIHAAQKFDERKGYRFYWYAVWWIRRAMYDALSADRTVTPKTHLARSIQKQMSAYIKRYGRKPSIEELAVKLKTNTKKIMNALTELLPTYSLDEVYNDMDIDRMDEDDYCQLVQRIGFVHDEHLYSPALDKRHIQNMRQEAFENALDQLEEREREVIKRNFGVGDYALHSLEDISRKLGLSRERIRQIKENALRNLRKNFIRALRKH